MPDTTPVPSFDRAPDRWQGEVVASVCPHDCPSTCALEVERLSPSRIGRVRGAEANGYTAGVICAKVARYVERVHHPERLTRPLKRRGAKGAGELVAISWEEALDETAAAFARAAERDGSEAVWPYYYAGTMGLVQRDGINRLRHALRYSGQKKTICTTLADSGWLAGVGGMIGVDSREMAQSDLVVIWGTNPVATQVNVMTHVARARKTNGARLVVIDPYRSGTAAIADQHLMLRPGTDGALACAVMHVLFRDGLADRGYLARYTDFPPGLEAHLAARGPDWAAAITGLTADEIEAFARAYGATKRSFIRFGYGFSRSRNGAANMHAATCLPAVTGAWAHEGGGGLYSFREIYHWNKTLIEGLDVCDPAIRQLDMSRIGAVLTHDRTDLGDGPPVTAMLVQNTNPAVVAPDSIKVRRGLAREDLFLCVHEQFLTETAAYADIVLPATTFLEHDDLYQAGAHPHIQIGPKVIEPPGEARANHEVICALAARLGARHPGFAMTAWEIIDQTLRASGWPDAESVRAARWVEVRPPFRKAHFLDGFPQAGGRFRFRPDWAAIGPDHARMPALPDHLPAIDAVDAEHRFRLVTAPARQFLNSSFSDTATGRRREGRPTLLIHPADADALGVGEGGRVAVGNRRGRVIVHARRFDGVQPGVVVVEGLWLNRDFEGGIGINALVGDDAAPPNGGAAFHDTAVWIRPDPAPADAITHPEGSLVAVGD